jgi:hypothetical protein
VTFGRRFIFRLVVFSTIVSVLKFAVHPAAAEPPHDPAAQKQSPVRSTDVAGNWHVSWQGRLGIEQCTLHLQQDGVKFTGTFQDLHGTSPVAGTVSEKQLSFAVQFKGKYPFTTQFKGTVDGDKIEGTSQAVEVGDGGAFLGHGGEVVHPEHLWTANRVAHQPAAGGESGSKPGAASQDPANR